jgi:hypothetical protein
MVGLTRFFCLMNLCEKSTVSPNFHKGITLFKKDAEFRLAKIFGRTRNFRRVGARRLRRFIVPQPTGQSFRPNRSYIEAA